tara:strand:- start:3256 stop:3480 length:225 start_codon:yes stop_codon:yes gene_type:complete
MFNVGDIIGYGGAEYKVVYVSTDGERVGVDSIRTGRNQGMNPASLFTLVTPAGPPPSVLTGMTQFFKDKEKSNV